MRLLGPGKGWVGLREGIMVELGGNFKDRSCLRAG